MKLVAIFAAFLLAALTGQSQEPQTVGQGETKKLKDTFALIAEELRHQYRLGFYPDALQRDGTHHALLVKVNVPDVSVRSRHEYLAK